MQDIIVYESEDLLSSQLVGDPRDHWRLDDWDLILSICAPVGTEKLRLVSGAGGLTITDATRRTIEINLAASLVGDTDAGIGVGSWLIEILAINRTNGTRRRLDGCGLTVLAALAKEIVV